MCCNLEHRISRGIHNRFPRFHVFHAKALYDFCTGCHLITKIPITGFFSESIHQFLRESIVKCRERNRNRMAHHFPMTTGCILSRTDFLHFPISTHNRCFIGLNIRNIGQAQRTQCRTMNQTCS